MKYCSTCHCSALKLYTLADEFLKYARNGPVWITATMQVCQRCLLEIKAKLSQAEGEK